MRIATIGLCDPDYSEDLARTQHSDAVVLLKKSVPDIVDAGLQPDEYKSKKVMTTLLKQHAENPFDALFLMQVAWARPAVLLQIIRAFPSLPMILYSPGSPVSNDGVIRSIAPAAGAGSTLPVLRRHGVKFKYVWSAPGQAIDEAEFMPFLRAAHAKRKLRGTKLGMVGFGDMRLQSTGFDVQEVHETFGVEVESVDMLEVQKEMDALDSSELDRQYKALTREWSYHGKKPDLKALKKVIAMFTVLDRWADQRGYVGLSIKCPTGVSANMGITPCLVGCLLARKYHYVCENDIPGLLCQVILGLLSDQMSTYWEFYEIFHDALLLGCCGFGPEVFLSEPLKVRTFEGFLVGMACCSSVKHGPYTIARLGKTPDGRYIVKYTEGDAAAPPAWCEDCLGQPQHPSVKFVPEVPVAEFVQEMLSQHVAVVPGRWAESFREFAKLTDILS